MRFLERLLKVLSPEEYLAVTSSLSVAMRVMEGQTRERMERDGLLSDCYMNPMIQRTYEKIKE